MALSSNGASPPSCWRAAGITEGPRPFALVVAAIPYEDRGTGVRSGGEDALGETGSYDTDEMDDLDEDPYVSDLLSKEPVAGDGLPGEVVVWGLAFRNRAAVFLHNPLTDRKDFGIFESAEDARRFYSRFGELYLVYA